MVSFIEVDEGCHKKSWCGLGDFNDLSPLYLGVVLRTLMISSWPLKRKDKSHAHLGSYKVLGQLFLIVTS